MTHPDDKLWRMTFLPTPARLSAFAICTTAIVSLAAQFTVSQGLMGAASTVETLWRMAGYFTILTNLGVAGVMAGAVAGRAPSARISGAITVAILMVGIVYHLILARLWAPVGLAWWADQGLHTAVPVLTAMWWLAFAPKSVGLRDLPAWLIWPTAYAGYAHLRGVMTGFWPYPFLDADALGGVAIAVNVVSLVAAFAALGFGLIALARWLVR